MSVQDVVFSGFANPVDPTVEELRAWAYHPDSVPLYTLPADWDLLVAGDPLIQPLFELAQDPRCPARRFVLHCLYIYSADTVRTNYRAHPKRRLRKMLEQAEQNGDGPMSMWAHNVRALIREPELFDYHDWCEGGLVRQPRRIDEMMR